ncbi:MAG: hypothetical protein HOK06_01170 [Rhodospirillaceae bacterium]|nr:hypothetical protein [Rhodospirillaceae bacterium]MBT7356755.1 hypothetical protein [Rhodospirillaceae bacterium]
MTGVSVGLDNASVSLSSGKGSLSGLSVGNPKGFNTDSAFKLGSVSVSLDTATAMSDPVVIKEIVISKPNVTYELGGSGSNIDAIQKNVDKFIAANSSGGSADKSEGGDSPKLIIENLYVRGGEINVSAAFLKGKALTTPLPDIHLKDIGKDDEGASPGEVASKLIDKILGSAGSAVGALNLDALAGAVGDGAKAVTEKLGKGGEALKEGASGAGDAIKGVGGKLKGMFGK